MPVRYRCAAGMFVMGALLAANATEALGFDLKVSGFGSIVAGEMLTGKAEVNPGNMAGPVFIADYGNGFAYTKRQVLLTPESRAGLQADVTIADQLSATIQGVGRTGSGAGSLEWAYLSYELHPEITVRAGRERIPIFYYSEFQDVGYAYIWIRPPGELYGWDMNSYDGASVHYHGALGDIAVSSSLFGGEGSSKQDGYFKPYYPYDITAQWNSLLGFDLEINKAWLTSRFVYMQSEDRYDTGAGDWSDYGFQLGHTTRQRIYGLAINVDMGKFFALTETNYITRSGEMTTVDTMSYSAGAGFRLGKWTPFINYSDYRDASKTPDTYIPCRFNNWALTLRYDVADGQDIKLQYNRFRDMAEEQLTGDSQLVSVSYDVSLSSR